MKVKALMNEAATGWFVEPTGTWVVEFKRLPAECLYELPLATSFGLYVPGSPGDVVGHGYELAEPRRADPAVVFDGLELEALVLGVQSDRVFPKDLLGWCLRKWDDRDFRLDLEATLSGATSERRAMTVGQVLNALDATLLWVDVQEPAEALGLETAAEAA